ncbi:MAG: HAD-IC family P-type ATPase, partial [Phascolarctobacterium sp.]|nr:HAD-IC family P-type ATPase [Phascolarctobacterium sp.]
NYREAAQLAKDVGIDMVKSKLLPQEKLEELTALRKKYGAVLFVGDGINDAPSLALADVSAAMGTGADVAIEAADIVFMRPEVSAIPKAFAIAKETDKIAWQNIVLAVGVKVVIILAGILGYASMWTAVFADTGVAMLCVFNSVRILYKKF